MEVEVKTLQWRKMNSEEIIAYSLHGAMIGRKDTAGPMGSGFLGANEPGYTLTASSQARHGVVITFVQKEESMATLMRMREGKPGGGKDPLISEDKSLTIATSNDQTLFVFENRYDEGIRINDSETSSTVRSAYGTGGGNVPMVAQSQVRRLTPVECERLQGFPDDWTAGQSDSTRYKQMGNAVAVPVVEWLIGNICDIV